jgi:hypothetical protein
MLNPRRLSLDSSATSDCEMGRIGPSANPIRTRDASNPMKPVARPDRNEHRESRTNATRRTDLR